jgi:hypothetical protein
MKGISIILICFIAINMINAIDLDPPPATECTDICNDHFFKWDNYCCTKMDLLVVKAVKCCGWFEFVFDTREEAGW